MKMRKPLHPRDGKVTNFHAWWHSSKPVASALPRIQGLDPHWSTKTKCPSPRYPSSVCIAIHRYSSRLVAKFGRLQTATVPPSRFCRAGNSPPLLGILWPRRSDHRKTPGLVLQAKMLLDESERLRDPTNNKTILSHWRSRWSKLKASIPILHPWATRGRIVQTSLSLWKIHAKHNIGRTIPARPPGSRKDVFPEEVSPRVYEADKASWQSLQPERTPDKVSKQLCLLLFKKNKGV